MVIITIPGACVSFSYTCWWCWFVFMFSSLPMYLTNNFCVLYIMEKETATHSSILAWKIPWTEEPGRLQFMLSPRIGHDRVTSLSFLYIKIYKIFNIYINNLSSRRTIFFFKKRFILLLVRTLAIIITGFQIIQSWAQSLLLESVSI